MIAEIVRGPGFSKLAGVESVALAIDAAWYMEMVDIVVLGIISVVKMTKATSGTAISDINGVEYSANSVLVEGDQGCIKFRTYGTVGKSVVLLTKSSTLFI